MTHDVCHCYDYNKTLCPETCYRAIVTKDLKNNIALYENSPISFASFKGTPGCMLTNGEGKK